MHSNFAQNNNTGEKKLRNKDSVKRTRRFHYLQRPPRGKMSSLRKTLSNRYAIFAIILIASFALILLQTAKLQLFGQSSHTALESRGSSSELSLSAPRGDIVDRNGVPLAVTESINTISIINVGLDNAAFNRMLLDLAKLFEENKVESESDFIDYFDISLADRKAREEGALSVENFVFKRPWEEIESFQTDEDTFNLFTPEKASNLRERQNLVKQTPREFFDFLLYDFFAIEPVAEEGNRLYSDFEAFQIMELRYLVLKNNWSFQIRNPIFMADNVPDSLTSLLNEQNFRFPGITVGHRYLRQYTSDSDIVSHALGYVGQISSDEYDALEDEGYSIHDVVGKTGVEQAAEPYLRGIPGSHTIESWRDPETGSPVAYPGAMGKIPQAGNEVRLTLDTNLQRVARDNLERKLKELRGFQRGDRIMTAPAGSVIVMDAKTGAVLVNANYPDYRVSDFVEQYSDPTAAARVQQLLTDTEQLPLLNRGISKSYAPGSTFKPITAMAAFENGTITAADTIYRCNGHEEIGGLTWRCLQKPYEGHGELNLQSGLMTSCNLYFYLLGVDVGIDAISETAQRLGLGESTHLDIANENLGLRPSRALKQKLNPKPEDKLWFVADTAQTAIGQFYNSYTMLQMARAIAGIATDHLVTPHFIKEIVASDGTVLVPEQVERIPLDLDDSGRAIIAQGMTGLTTWDQGRTAELFRDFPVSVAAKTGTAEVVAEDGKIYTNAVFVAYAPVDDPEIVVSSILEDSSYGDQSADIAYRILCEYFGYTPSHDYMGLYDDESARLTEGFAGY